MDQIENDTSNEYSVACIRCRGNMFTEPLPSNEKRIHLTERLRINERGIHTEEYRLMGEIYEVRQLDGLRYRDIYVYQVSFRLF
jgi:hypothetical protein